MAIVAFQQDPSAAPGTGYFADEYGNQRYAYDPVTAQNLAQQGAPDLRLAQGGGPNGGTFGAAMTGMAGGERRGSSSSTSDALPSYAQSPPTTPIGQSAAQLTAPPGQAPGNENQAITGVLQNNIGKSLLADQNKPATKGGFTPQKREETISDVRRPLSPDEQQQFWQTDAERAQATVNSAKLDRESELGAANAEMASMVPQQANIAVAKKKRDLVNGMVQKDLADYSQMDQELKQNQKSFNPNRLFDEKLGTSGTIAAALFRAIGQYAQVMGHQSTNAAGDIIDAAIARDVAQQREAIESGKGNVDNALNRFRIHFGDLDLAQKALENLQHNYADTQMQFMVHATNAPKVIENARAGLAAQADAAQKRDIDFRDRSFGVASRKVEDKYQPASGGGGQTPEQAIGRFKNYSEALKTYNEANTRKADPTEVAIDDISGVQRQLGRARELLNQGINLSPEGRQELASIQRVVTMVAPHLLTPTRLNETVMKQIQGIIGNPDAWVKTDAMGQTRKGIETLNSVLEDKKKTLRKSGTGEPDQGAPLGFSHPVTPYEGD